MINSLKRAIYQALISLVLVQIASAQTELTDEQRREITAMAAEFNHSTPAYRAAVTQMALVEANYFAKCLKLPTPIRITDIAYPYPRIGPPWFSVLRKQYPPYPRGFPETVFTTNIYNTNIMRETRLRAVTVAICGMFGTTNFVYCFNQGKLREVMRISGPDEERYSRNLDDLVGKPSLIDHAQAYQMATQWLAAVDVDMTALAQLKWTVNQLHYLLRGTSNTVDLPLYYVDFKYKDSSASSNLLSMGQPPVSVEILGTTKELQDLNINDLSFSRRPLLFITNVLDLVQTANPKMRQLERPAAP